MLAKQRRIGDRAGRRSLARHAPAYVEGPNWTASHPNMAPIAVKIVQKKRILWGQGEQGGSGSWRGVAGRHHHLPTLPATLWPTGSQSSPRLVLDACIRLIHIAIKPGQHERDDACLRKRHNLQIGEVKQPAQGGWQLAGDWRAGGQAA